MKSAIITLGALVAAVSAQSISDLPSCGQICANNMLASDKADELGCSPGDVRCLCLNVNFTYGFRDCSLAVCSPEDAQRILEYGLSVCSNVGVQIATTGSNGQAVATATASENADDASINYSTIFATVTSGGETITAPIATTILGVGSGADEAASSAAAVVTTITRDGSAIVSTITSAAGAIGSSASDIASSVASEVGSDISSITSAAGSAISSIASDASSAASEAGSAISSVASDLSSELSGISSTLASVISSATDDSTTTGSEGEATSSESDGAAMPQKTAAPMGMIAAAGLAALLL